MFGDEQGWKFSDRNASLIASSLIQAQAGNPDAVLALIDRANKAYLTADGGKALQAEDANLLTGLTNMGMFTIGQDAEGNAFVDKSPQWQSLTDATTNVLSNESMIRKERVDIQTGDYDITEKLNFMQYETLPDIQQSLNEVELQSLLEEQMKNALDLVVDEENTYKNQKINAEEAITTTSDSLENLSDQLASKVLRRNMMRDEQKSGYAFDKVEFENISSEIDSIKESMDVLESQLKTQNDARLEASRKIELEDRGIPVTEKNVERLEQEKAMDKMMAEWEFQMAPTRRALVE
jgi:hypothetical protein